MTFRKREVTFLGKGDSMDIIERQRHYYKEGHTLNPTWRKEQLRRLKDAIKVYEPSLYIAFEKDLGKEIMDIARKVQK